MPPHSTARHGDLPRIIRLLILLAALGPAILQAEDAIRVKAGQRMDLSGSDDVARLHHLASGVGWEFEPDATTTAGLKRIGIRSIRCINVDPLEGSFTTDGTFTIADPAGAPNLTRLIAHLNTCRELGAVPHIVIGTGLPPELRVPVGPQATGPGIMGQGGHLRSFGPTDPARYTAYCEAYMTWVMVTQGFREARFEYGNESDIAGQFPYPRPPLPGMGSRALFDGYLAAYRLAAAAANRVATAHPELRLLLGGPASACYTFRFGDFNWPVRFIEECAAQGLRLDFIGLHYYGNISPLDGPTSSGSVYPPFTSLLATVLEARDRCLSTVPIWITEWGPTYHTGASNPLSAVNNDSMGAAWCLTFLDLLVQCPVNGAMFLTTTDLRRKRADGGWDNLFGFPTLFTNPKATGTALPKATFHAFDLMSRLRGRRVEATRPGRGIGCFAVAEAEPRCLRVLAWNFDAKLPELVLPVEQANRRLVPLDVMDAAAFFGGQRVTATTWMVSARHGDGYSAVQRGEPLTAATTAAVQTASSELTFLDGRVATVLDLPPSSFALIEFVAIAPPQPTP